MVRIGWTLRRPTVMARDLREREQMRKKGKCLGSLLEVVCARIPRAVGEWVRALHLEVVIRIIKSRDAIRSRTAMLPEFRRDARTGDCTHVSQQPPGLRLRR